jgi:hypothetical protein
MSKYLDKIIAKKKSICYMHIVFIDIVKYSKRKTARQVELINEFTSLIEESIKKTTKDHFDSFHPNKANLIDDSIKIPTGDGMAIGMPFEWIKELHLDLSLNILKLTDTFNKQTPCEIFNKNGFCNCHNNFTIRLGISAGQVILYKDINSNYNIAGNPINMAARVMNLGDPSQIMFTSEAHKQFLDLSTEQNLFHELKDIEIKHGHKVTLFQYLNPSIPYLNSQINHPPTNLKIKGVTTDKKTELHVINDIDFITLTPGSYIRFCDDKKNQY